MKLGASRHINEEEIEQYSLGTVPAEQLASLEEHLLACEACQSRVQKSDEFLAAMRGAGDEYRRNAVFSRRRFGMRLTPIMAGTAAMFLAAVGWEVSQRGGVTPYRVELEATRGGSETVVPKAPAGRSLEVKLDVATVPAAAVYRVEVVDDSGRAVWQGQASAQNYRLTVSLPRLRAGDYFIRVYDLAGKLLREFGLEAAA